MNFLTSNAKLEVKTMLSKDIKRQGFSFQNLLNFKKYVFITLNIKKENTRWPFFELLIIHYSSQKTPAYEIAFMRKAIS